MWSSRSWRKGFLTKDDQEVRDLLTNHRQGLLDVFERGATEGVEASARATFNYGHVGVCTLVIGGVVMIASMTTGPSIWVPTETVAASSLNDAGNISCGTRSVSTTSLCQTVAAAIGHTFGGTESRSRWPKGCYLNVQAGLVHLNMHPSGSGRPQTKPLCQSSTPLTQRLSGSIPRQPMLQLSGVGLTSFWLILLDILAMIVLIASIPFILKLAARKRPPAVAPDSARSSSLQTRERQKYLPVGFLWFLIFTPSWIYVCYHCVPMMYDESSYSTGRNHLVAWIGITTMLITCFLRSMLVHPGSIPANDPLWEYMPGDTGVHVPIRCQQLKKNGDRRHCKWCAKYKPDRCHHCRICKTCILKMDHHCPWIYNCVGFGNHKYVFLLLFYSALDLHLLIWTMNPWSQATFDTGRPLSTMFLLLFGWTIALFFGFLATMFFSFWVWLMMKGDTMIEFCEKSLPGAQVVSSSPYDLGGFGNIKAVLGAHVVLWLLPCSPPPGDGLHFVSDLSRRSLSRTNVVG